jgi:hypothetical protein
MNFASQCDFDGYDSYSREFYYMSLDPFHIYCIFASPLSLKLASELIITLSIYSFDCCACIAENPSAHPAMMLAIEESEVLPAFHALVDLAVRNLPKFKRKRYILPRPSGQVHCSADSSQIFLLAADWWLFHPRGETIRGLNCPNNLHRCRWDSWSRRSDSLDYSAAADHTHITIYSL